MTLSNATGTSFANADTTLVAGSVQGADGAPLASIDVRFFEVACSGSDQCFGAMRVQPILRAETHTNTDGTFQAVVPVQQ